MGKNSHRFKRGGNSNRGRHFKDFKGKHSPQPKNLNAWKGRSASSDGSRRPERAEQIEKVSLKEHQVGITEFVSSGKGFTGVVKARFSDFHVNEIDLDGTVLQLNDLTVPPKTNNQKLTPEQVDAAKSEISDVVTDEKWKEIEEIAKDERTEPCDIDVTNLDKDMRTKIHNVIKSLYEKDCNSTTMTKDDDKKFICVKRQDKDKKKRYQWVYGGEYVHFLIYKENMDTSEVAVLLANYLRLPPSQINYCGTKDKRGITTQKFCVRKRHPSQIAQGVKNIQSVKIGNFSFNEKVIKLGDLKGNRFRVALRHVNGDRAEIEKSLQSIKKYGFINYYGLQRFGNNASIPTYEVGIALLKSDYKTACELILKPRENDMPFMRAIREAWWKNRDSTAAAAMFHNSRFIEKKVLDGLSEYGENDYANSLRKIPRNMLLLYTHAYQSLIFNLIASRRIKEYGLKLMIGDLVYRNQDELDVIALDTESVLTENDLDEKTEDTKEHENESVFKQKVKSLTEEEISSGKYTIFDIVLPLPGHDITYPANEVAEWYEDILATDDLSSEKLKHAVKTFSLAGAYRKLLVQPENMTWYFQHYNFPEEDVIKSHFEKSVVNNENSDGEGKFTALVLDFCLPASVYATMFLREILKSDTSATSQAEIGRNEMKKFEEKNRTEEKDKKENDNQLEVTKKKLDAPLSDETDDKQSTEETDEPGAKRLKQDTE